MIRRTPASTMRGSPVATAGPLPLAAISRLMRITSSGVSGRSWRAASSMRCASGCARSTSAPGPESESESPRSDTFTPVSRDSSSRLASLTPASVSWSAPSAFSRLVTASSLTRRGLRDRLGESNVQLTQILLGHRTRRALEQGARLRGLGECNDIAQRGRTSERHCDPIEPQSDTAVRWRTGAQTFEQEAEALRGHGLVNAQQFEHALLQTRVRNANAAAAQLGAVQHDIIRQRVHAFGMLPQQGLVIGTRGGERVMHSAERSGHGVTLEQGEVRHPEKAAGLRRHQVEY